MLDRSPLCWLPGSRSPSSPHRECAGRLELAVGLALLVATAVFLLESKTSTYFRLEFGYGSMVSFVGAALLIALSGLRTRPKMPAWRSITRRATAIAGCVAYLVVLLLPWWKVLPRHTQSALAFAPLSWLTIAGALVGIHLMFLWLRRITDGADNPDWLLGLPLFMLALASIDLIERRNAPDPFDPFEQRHGISWGGGIIVGLCIALAFLGNAERRGGLRQLRLPEVLRIDGIDRIES